MRMVKTYTVEYTDINGVTEVTTVEAYNEFWAKVLFRTMYPLCTLVSIN